MNFRELVLNLLVERKEKKKDEFPMVVKANGYVGAGIDERIKLYLE